MDVTRQIAKVEEERWARHRYNLTTGLGEDGRRITGTEEHMELSRRTACEGTVLLKNGGTLPLKKGCTVALFGIGSLDYVQCGGGSGRVFSKHIYNLYDGLMLKKDKQNKKLL